MVGGAVGLAMTWTVPTIASGYARQPRPATACSPGGRHEGRHHAPGQDAPVPARRRGGGEVIITPYHVSAVRLVRPGWWTVPEAVRHSWGTSVLQLVDARLPDSGTLLAPAILSVPTY